MRLDSIPAPPPSSWTSNATTDRPDPLALSLENRRLEAELRASRSEVVEAGIRVQRRIERDLHDGAQQRLVLLALNLALARERLDARDGEAARQLLDDSREELDQALAELRELARGVHPSVLSERGLGPAIESLARRAPLPVSVRVATERRLPERVEQAAYFVVSEALTNVARYARASQAEVAATSAGGVVAVEVRDDGVGGADPQRGSGLEGLEARLEWLSGELELDSPPEGGTTLRARIPLAYAAVGSGPPSSVQAGGV